jgi:hypothetical protein
LARLRNGGGSSQEEEAPSGAGGEAGGHGCADEAVRALKPSCIKVGVDAVIEALKALKVEAGVAMCRMQDAIRSGVSP